MGLAIDEALLLSVDQGLVPNTVRFYYFDPPAVVVGLNQDVSLIDFEYMNEKKMSFGRRLTGGGAIIIGCPNYSSQMGISFLFKLDDTIPKKLSHKFKYFSETMMKTLKNLGLRPEYNRNSDITLKQKKIVGSGIYLTDNALLFHSILLFEYDSETMFNVLTLKNDEAQHGVLERMQQSITTLNEELNHQIPPEVVETELIHSIQSVWKNEVEETAFTEWEKQTITELFQTKYSTTSWNLQTAEDDGLRSACFVPSDSED